MMNQNNLTQSQSNQQMLKSLTSNGLGAFSYGIFQYGISFMLLHATHSPLSFGMNIAVGPLISLLTFISIGNFVDTHNHKRIIFWGYILRIIGFIALALALPFFHGESLLIPVALFIAIDSILVNLRNTAYSASIRQLVKMSDVAKLTSLTTAVASASRILSPVLGITLYALISVEGLIVLEILATIVAMIIMMTLHFFKVDDSKREKVSQVEQFKQTLQYVKKRPFIRDSIVAEIVVNFFYTAVVTGSPFIIVNQLGLPNSVVIWTETGYSIGYLTGSLITSQLKEQRHFGIKIMSTMILVGISLLGLGGLFLITRNQIIVSVIGMLLSLLMELSFAIFDLAIEIRLQSTVEHSILGRVSSTLYTVGYAIMPFGTLVYTWLYDTFSDGSYIMIASGVILIVYTVFSISKFIKNIRIDDVYVEKHADQINS
ncbi:MFS transporter [Lactobacillus kunkeei]|nr:MFS transporter [Apilactobacillus kunkeei]TMS99884.1 MFS transporter [Apilactobacillus kunkeei]TMT03234.1 MFS transporter [Apilactobacillus kunkeei]